MPKASVTLPTALHQSVPPTVAKAERRSGGLRSVPLEVHTDTGPGAGHTSRARHQEAGGGGGLTPRAERDAAGSLTAQTVVLHTRAALLNVTQAESVRVRTLLGRTLKSQ